MNSTPSNVGVWLNLARALNAKPPGTVVAVPKWQVPHPVDSGAYPSIGLPVGQTGDFRWRRPDCSGLHAREFPARFELHVDRVDPSCGFVEHLRQDAPDAYVAGAAAIGALVGVLLGRSKEATLAGAGVGALLGVVTLPPEKRVLAAANASKAALKIVQAAYSPTPTPTRAKLAQRRRRTTSRGKPRIR